jgi:hypothetical protein
MTQDKFEAIINGQKIPRGRLAEMFDELTETCYEKAKHYSEIRRRRKRLGVGRNGRIASLAAVMIVIGCRCDLVWHSGRKGNGDGKANHSNDERGYYNSG